MCDQIAIKCIRALRATFVFFFTIVQLSQSECHQQLCVCVCVFVSITHWAMYMRAQFLHLNANLTDPEFEFEIANACIWGDHAVLHLPYATLHILSRRHSVFGSDQIFWIWLICKWERMQQLKIDLFLIIVEGCFWKHLFACSFGIFFLLVDTYKFNLIFFLNLSFFFKLHQKEQPFSIYKRVRKKSLSIEERKNQFIANCLINMWFNEPDTCRSIIASKIESYFAVNENSEEKQVANRLLEHTKFKYTTI